MKKWIAAFGVLIAAPSLSAQEALKQYHLVGVQEYDPASLLEFASHAVLSSGYIDGNRLAATVEQIYREDGYALAYVKLASDGKTILVNEGRIGSVRIEGVDKDVYNLIAKYSAPLLRDNAVSIDEIERTLMLIQDIETLNATTEISYPDPDGDAELRIVAEQLSESWGQFTLDTPDRKPNSALTATIDQYFYHVAAAGDLLKLSLSSTYEFSTKNPTISGALAYRAPVGANGNYVEGYFGTMQARYNALGALQQTDLDGSTSIIAMGSPVVRTVDRYGYLIGELRHATSSATNATSTFKTSATVGSAIWLDGQVLEGGGSLEYAVSFSLGNQTGETEASSSFNYARFGVGYGHPIKIGSNYAQLALQATGQVSSFSLPSTEKMMLGGRGANRAYDYGEISGDSALSLSFELVLDGNNKSDGGLAVEPLGFVDFGWAKNNAFGSTAASTAKSSSVGAGIRFSLPQSLYGEAYVAVPLVAGSRTAKGDPAFYVSVSRQW